jgi:hypothetical protein
MPLCKNARKCCGNASLLCFAALPAPHPPPNPLAANNKQMQGMIRQLHVGRHQAAAGCSKRSSSSGGSTSRRHVAAASTAAAAAAATQTLTITTPDDWHLHLRDGDSMRSVAHHSAAHFARAIVMPNLVPPVTTTAAALEYKARILDALQSSSSGGSGSTSGSSAPMSSFTPLMTLYLTDVTAPSEVAAAKAAGVAAFKLYPAGATTNSGARAFVLFGFSKGGGHFSNMCMPATPFAFSTENSDTRHKHCPLHENKSRRRRDVV